MALRSRIPSQLVREVRKFNRYYTRQIGVLQNGLLSSPFSLTEVRVLYELAHRDRPTARDLGKELGLDAGYLSRLLGSFEKRRLIRRKPSPADGRQSLLRLTGKGRKVFTPLEVRSNRQVADMLGKVGPRHQKELLSAMHSIEQVLENRAKPAPYVLRTHQPGDMGWVVHRHGALYWQEYGYDERFEALVAKIVAEFIQKFDVKRERCWIAERDGDILGTVFLVRKSKTICKLRLLLVEPSARGLGLGRRLVAECIRFAQAVGFRKMMLWTQSELGAARHLYKEAGFRRVERRAHKSWGRDLVSEVWERRL
jgi:DNA-binding MarR family transcriptional regulator/N-acetylglutamate synthase-like GNAT family acetyltransferase